MFVIKTKKKKMSENKSIYIKNDASIIHKSDNYRFNNKILVVILNERNQCYFFIFVSLSFSSLPHFQQMLCIGSIHRSLYRPSL